MRRAPLVLSATAAGLAGVLAFHVTPATRAGRYPAAVAAAPQSSGGTGGTGADPQPTPTGSGAPAWNGTGGTAGGTGGTRTVTGQSVSTRYGDVQVQVTVSGGRLTQVRVTKAPNDERRSVDISDYAVPLLDGQALAAQSARIDGVSGASYTSAGYERSLQSALDQAGVAG